MIHRLITSLLATAVAVLLGASGAAAAGTATVTREFDSASSLRIEQSVSVSGTALAARFYSGYESGEVTIANRTDKVARFSSFQGFVAKVTPGDVFAVPCDDLSIAGRLDILHQTETVSVDEQALCGDLVLIGDEEAS